MKFRIAMWAVAGFLVAGCWALFIFATAPYANESMRNVWVLAAVTCPITLVRHVPVSLYSVLAANAATYALVGLIVETLRGHRIAHHKHS
jgi:hypothetical protein